uniref:Protein MCM10 homolog n=1 Tax=Salarias fasciatus TaxID=181472 RepID=A0A672J6W4_SALFA
GSREQADDLDGLFDEDCGEEEEYKESLEDEDEEKPDVVIEDEATALFGDVGDIETEEDSRKKQSRGETSEDRSKEELQDELRRMQEQMQRLQQQLEVSQKASPPSAPKNADRSAASKPAAAAQKARTQTGTGSGSVQGPVGGDQAWQLLPASGDSCGFQTRASPRGPQQQAGSSFIPAAARLSAAAPQRRDRGEILRTADQVGQQTPFRRLTVDFGSESGLNFFFFSFFCRKPRVSSCEMDRKMADRRLIRLSQVPERLAREKLEDSDWVTFGVSGKTFSIWKLNDLHNLDVNVSLLLFGDVHKEHWKTEPGAVLGLLNPNPMKQRDGYEGVSLTVDHPQKVLLMGEAQDFGTCKAAKKNGEPCSQIVNMYECPYCQYHVKAQYKKMSSKRAELQSSFSGKAPNKVLAKGKGGGGGLRERLCQDGFHYGGVSSAACAASLTASKPNKPVQRTLDKLFVKGSAQLVTMQSGEVSGCSDDFKSLMSVPTPGALQLKKHLEQGASPGAAAAPLQSISASELLKQQKQRQRELLESRRRRAEEAQKRENPAGGGGLLSPRAASEAPTHSPALPRPPTLGRGFSRGEDILFFDDSPPPAPALSSLSLTASKMAALRKLKAKGLALEKEDPNAVKRKRSDDGEISARVEKNRTSPNGQPHEEEPALKKKRDQLRYVQSEEFQKILNAKSRHDVVLQAAEYQLQERYFDALVKKEQMEEKMRGVREMKCRAVTCRKCSYTYFKPADRCVAENHDLRWHDALKRFFRCPCGQRAIALDRLPHKHCSNCGLFKWERDGMLKEKAGPKIGGELLQPRGEEHAKFLNSMK